MQIPRISHFVICAMIMSYFTAGITLIAIFTNHGYYERTSQWDILSMICLTITCILLACVFILTYRILYSTYEPENMDINLRQVIFNTQSVKIFNVIINRLYILGLIASLTFIIILIYTPIMGLISSQMLLYYIYAYIVYLVLMWWTIIIVYKTYLYLRVYSNTRRMV